MENAVIICPTDSVVTAIDPIQKGEALYYPNCELPVVALSDIAIYHKVAISDIKKGEDVIKYGEKIGVASSDIAAGEHVHTHNLSSVRT